MVSIPLDRISAEARQLRFWRTVLLVAATVLFFVGWLIGKLFVVLWAALTWGFAAIKIGWRDAHKPRGN